MMQNRVNASSERVLCQPGQEFPDGVLIMGRPAKVIRDHRGKGSESSRSSFVRETARKEMKSIRD